MTFSEFEMRGETIKLMKICPLGVTLVHEGGRTDLTGKVLNIRSAKARKKSLELYKSPNKACNVRIT
jgi:hypothetical protein